MSDMSVRIVNLPPMRVACVNGFGEGPEGIAFDKMKAWAQAHNLLEEPHRLFGYNNPDPSPGSPNYGYDVWLTVDESLQADGEARIIDFPGGLYAVTRTEVKNPGDDIPGAWQKLVKWMESSRYRHGRHQWLEEHIGPLAEMGGNQPFTLDLHLPINE
ncbi:MAG TPA: GyrI-like domain-containing protein [Anaerolineales bacterium]|nr:GyrI-like domain-containing protein [Anaerolineales bacterium]